MTISVGLIVEIVVNFIQIFAMFGTLWLFFDKPEHKTKSVIAFWICVFFMFSMNNYFTFNELTFNHLDAVISILFMILFAVFFLKGALYLRIFIPLAINLVQSFVAYFLITIMTVFGKIPFEQMVTFSTAFRYLFLFVCWFITLSLFWIIIRIGRNRIKLNNIYDVLSFIVIPLVSYSAIIMLINLYEDINFDKKVIGKVVIIMGSIIILSVIFWFLLTKLSRDNEIKTNLLLSEQREEMYKNAVLDTNVQIEKMSMMKHDMKNSLKSIQGLIQNGQYAEASRLCSDSFDGLQKIYTPVSTPNPTLNAILNVELEKADAADIDFSYNISDSLDFVSSSDTVSIIGNLCDNAIEYLSLIDKSQRKMSLEISAKKDFRIIACRNTILSSVLNKNPDLKTTKNDRSLHGKGMNILRDVAKKYGGEVNITEWENEIEVSLILSHSVG